MPDMGLKKFLGNLFAFLIIFTMRYFTMTDMVAIRYSHKYPITFKP